MQLSARGIQHYAIEHINRVKYAIGQSQQQIPATETSDSFEQIQSQQRRLEILQSVLSEPTNNNLKTAIPNYQHVIVDDAIIRNILCILSNCYDGSTVDIYLLFGKYHRCTFDKFISTIRSHEKMDQIASCSWNERLDQHPDDAWLESPDTQPRFRYHTVAYSKNDNPNPSVRLRVFHDIDPDRERPNATIVYHMYEAEIPNINYFRRSKQCRIVEVHPRQLDDCECGAANSPT